MRNYFIRLKGLLAFFILLAFAFPLQAQDRVTVLRVVDGDTLEANYKGKEESIMLIGIDAPESRPNKKAKNDAQRSGEDLKTITAMGKEATNYVKGLVRPRDAVKMEFDVQLRGTGGEVSEIDA